MQFSNLTPHTVTIECDHGAMLVLPPSGTAPRLAVGRQSLGSHSAQHHSDMVSVPFVRSTMGEPEGLPDPQKGMILIVSALVAEHPSLAHRTDLAYPGEAVRDSEGKIVGCRGLCAGTGLALILRQKADEQRANDAAEAELAEFASTQPPRDD